ncbi:MAG: hypothetical protein ABI591_22160 [Kofleriaceae bacterium]
MSTTHSNSEQRPTCKMTPEQLLGLQRTARAKTATLTPEISIIDPNAAPTVIVAEGTQESVPIEIDDDRIDEPSDQPSGEPNELDHVLETLAVEPAVEPAIDPPGRPHRPSPLGAVIGFALFAAVTAAEILVVVWS